MKRKGAVGHKLNKCCDIKVNAHAPECYLNPVHESLFEKVTRLKSNSYMTKEVWQAKIIFIVDTGKWYSYADIDSIMNN